jgi:LCP family protein required for cell wall assembly
MHKKKPLIVVGIFVAILAIIFIAKTVSYYPFLFQLFFDKGVNLKQNDSRINILILGIGGGDHEGPNLTDTIILANLNEKDNKVTLFSIPRDLWLPDLTGNDKKINNAYSDGERKRLGGGIPLAKAAVSKVTGQKIDYAVRIDFSGFVKAVDVVGGLDVNVEKSFDDYEYPISGKENDPCGKTSEDLDSLATMSAEQQVLDLPCRYKHLHFDKGLNHMDGQTALEFVRSRHAVGSEGSDFARSKRQEKIINGFKEKLLSAETLINPAKILNLYAILKGSIDTDIKQEEFDDFIRLAQKMQKADIKSAIIDVGDEETQRQGLLTHPLITSEYNYEWVLTPRLGNGNFSEIYKYVSCEVSSGDCPISKVPLN